MYSPYAYETTRFRHDELIAEAGDARRRREAAGPSILQRLAARIRFEPVPGERPALSARGAQAFTPTRTPWRVA